ncbi:hypothetical protein AVEN_97209-1 [Araneus ventricosus]|uniref:Uncharacterized protein n=1 Tax=Araneus ventricosus TaxID=182803 RepID=A0A4Y2GCD9_ARAVE|nr:hypothetical protein AVEN_97209-1 [Araneus ventricosus]
MFQTKSPVTDQLAKRDTTKRIPKNLQRPISFLKKTLMSAHSWQRKREEGTNSRQTFHNLPKVVMISSHLPGNEILFVIGDGAFPSSFKRLCDSNKHICGYIGSPIHYANSSPLTLFYRFKTPSTIHKVSVFESWFQISIQEKD